MDTTKSKNAQYELRQIFLFISGKFERSGYFSKYRDNSIRQTKKQKTNKQTNKKKQTSKQKTKKNQSNTINPRLEIDLVSF